MTEFYSYNGTFVLKAIFRDRSVDVLTSSWRYKGPIFCHPRSSFDLRPSYFRHLLDLCHHFDHCFFVSCFGSLGLHDPFVLVVRY